MFGTHDGIAIVDVPDSVSIAAVNVATLSTGTITHVQTQELLTEQQLSHVLQRARDAAQVFRLAGRRLASSHLAGAAEHHEDTKKQDWTQALSVRDWAGKPGTQNSHYGPARADHPENSIAEPSGGYSLMRSRLHATSTTILPRACPCSARRRPSAVPASLGPVEDRCELPGLDEPGAGEQLLPLLFVRDQPEPFPDQTVDHDRPQDASDGPEYVAG